MTDINYGVCHEISDLVELQVRLAANSCVTKDIREPGDYGGFPAVRFILFFLLSHPDVWPNSWCRFILNDITNSN